ncbi:tRNA lysidine(34) synthetase TilS [Alishewanella tabrizica]|uniref:tRNA(Ile)-lysidine synthase n=1 Tax=Alishewanella tabrizica TaxID=671278 RepID=A0ABQ2WEM0_9ALTE|nr:tRNA lysidine(34) synthetase TilS [Alishewanella tabrizica]GGW51256.1 tRNA(Ile)-lysidine synthase [Alishewanella tabrizica]
MLALAQVIKTALLAQIEQLAHPAGETRLVLAYSGGLDSQVLLHILAPICHDMAIALFAVHVHHGLNRQADAWATFCETQCRARQVDFHLRYVSLDPQHNVEQEARTARYAALAQFVTTPSTLLLTAHHADDQLETVLLALKRGAGLTGLAGIPQLRAFAQGQLYRPLLTFSRQQLEAFAVAEQLHWIEDDSNANTDFDRNFLRHIIAPPLKQRWPALTKTVTRSAEHLQHAHTLAEHYTSLALTACLEGDRLNLLRLAQYHPLQQPLVIRQWLAAAGLNPDTQWLSTLQAEVIGARQDATPILHLGSLQVRRYLHWLYLLADPPAIRSGMAAVVSVGKPQYVAEGQGYLHWHAEGIQGAVAIASDHQEFTVGFGLLSSNFKPSGQPTKPLKQWFKLWQVPPWQRSQVPLLFADETLYAVVGFASRCAATAGKNWLSWQPVTPQRVPQQTLGE